MNAKLRSFKWYVDLSAAQRDTGILFNIVHIVVLCFLGLCIIPISSDLTFMSHLFLRSEILQRSRG